jgi:DNA-binding response OmpR family regulator
MKSEPEHILVVEDQPAHRNVLAFNLTQAGFRVTVAASPVKAFALAQHEQFDLIITDYYLPDYSGSDFVKLLRKTDNYVATPVVMLTGRAEELNVQALRDTLSVLVLSKPCSMARLLEIVSKCLEAVRTTC